MYFNKCVQPNRGAVLCADALLQAHRVTSDTCDQKKVMVQQTLGWFGAYPQKE